MPRTHQEPAEPLFTSRLPAEGSGGAAGRRMCRRVSPPRIQARWAGLLLLPLIACSSPGTSQQGAQSGVAGIEHLLVLGDYPGAVEAAARFAKDNPQDEAALAWWKRASAAYWLDVGRRQTFRGENQVALESFERARALLPDSQVVAVWVGKGHQELAAIARAAGFEAEGSGDFPLARRWYAEALAQVPEDQPTLAALERVEAIERYYQERSSEYYTQGVSALRDLRTAEAIQRFQAALKYEPDSEASQEREGEVNRLLAEERTSVGRELQDLGLYRAARTEYRLAKEVEPDLEEAVEGYERVDVEVRVLDLLEQADTRLRAKDFAAALALIDQAAELTRSQKEQVASLRDQADKERLDAAYQHALELEQDFRYPDAIEAFDRLLEDQGGFYADARARRDTLAGYVADAERLYAELLVTVDRDQELQLLRQIDLLWPGYRDVSKRLKTREKAEERARAEAQQPGL